MISKVIFLVFLTVALCFKLEQVLDKKVSFDYDLEQSKQFQSYCVLTHCNKNLLLNWNCKLCPKLTALQQRTYIDNNLTNTVALVGYHQKLNSIILVFRGTQDVKNWIQDFSYYQIQYPRCKNCKIHSGFYTAYLSISLQITKTVENLLKKYPNAEIVTIGSSLGASIAVITALQFQIIFGKVKQLQIFGGPRVGDQNFVKFLTQKVSKIRRIIHNRDIVPHVPLISQNFVHPPFEIWFDEQMSNYKVCNQSGQDPSCSDSIYPNFSIQDHIGYWQKPIVSQICQ